MTKKTKKKNVIDFSAERLAAWNPTTQATLSDKSVKGLHVRGGPSGVKTFVRYTTSPDGKPVREILGRWSETDAGGISIKTAREMALAKKVAKKSQQATGGGATVGDLLAEYREKVMKKREHGDDAMRVIRRHVAEWVSSDKEKARLGAFENWPLASVEVGDLVALVRSVMKKRPRVAPSAPGETAKGPLVGGERQARKVLGELRAMFRHAVDVGKLTRDPTATLSAGTFDLDDAESRDRSLSVEEMRSLFAALKDSPKMAEVTKLAIKFLCYVPARTGSLIQAEWSEIDWKAATWTIPVAHLKMKKKKRADPKTQPQVVHLPAQAVAILRRLQVLAGRSRFVLASPAKKGESPLDSKALIHALSDMQDREAGRLGAWKVASPVNVHDLRATWRTWAHRLGADFIAAERVMGHKTSDDAGRVAGIYLRGDFWDKQVQALEAVAEAIDDAVAGKPAKVTNIHAARG